MDAGVRAEDYFTGRDLEVVKAAEARGEDFQGVYDALKRELQFTPEEKAKVYREPVFR